MRIRLFASFQLFIGRFHEPGRGPRSSSITNDDSRRRAADPEVPRLRTWVSIMVVVTSLWPSSSWIVRMSWPRSSRWVANEWRNRILPGQGIGHQDAALLGGSMIPASGPPRAGPSPDAASAATLRFRLPPTPAAGCPDHFSPSPCERRRRHSRPHHRASRC